ncbi:MAG: membrane protein [Chloroflexota bacterium]|nr:MAG: membrane protein [Chloroflexota bacterium]
MAVATQEKPPIQWWLVLIQGIATLLIGIFLLTDPVLTSRMIVFYIGIYWLVTGVLSLVRIFTDRGNTVWKLISGIIGILAGWFLVSNITDGATLVFGIAAVIILGVQGIIMGIFGLVESFQGAGWGPGIIGAISIVIGLMLLGSPLGYALMLPWVIGIFAIVGGIFTIFFAFRLRNA